MNLIIEAHLSPGTSLSLAWILVSVYVLTDGAHRQNQKVLMALGSYYLSIPYLVKEKACQTL